MEWLAIIVPLNVELRTKARAVVASPLEVHKNGTSVLVRTGGHKALPHMTDNFDKERSGCAMASSV
jgi:hypothetical protein